MTGMNLPKRAHRPLRHVLCVAAVLLLGNSAAVHAQGLVQGVQQEQKTAIVRLGRSAVFSGGAIGGVVGVVGGVLGVPSNNVRGPVGGQSSAKQTKAAKKGKKGAQPAAEPELTAEQIVASSDANTSRIKTSLNLTPEREKNWAGFSNAMHTLGNNGAERLKLRIARAKRGPPDGIIEQMRNEGSVPQRPGRRSARRCRCRWSRYSPRWMTSRRLCSFRRWSASAASAVSTNRRREEPLGHGDVFLPQMKETIMAEKFDPAPHDKYAVGVKEAARADRKTSEELKTGLKDGSRLRIL